MVFYWVIRATHRFGKVSSVGLRKMMECVKHAVGCFEWIVLRGGWGGIGGNLGRRGWFLDAHAAEIGGVCDGSDGWRRSTFAAECNELRGLGLLVLRRLGEECSWREEFCGKQAHVVLRWRVPMEVGAWYEVCESCSSWRAQLNYCEGRYQAMKGGHSEVVGLV
ncbi:uncharacterized protein [Physcomitrium patens]|nr:uncharacterized protein LOC112296113 isoform X2 [Physcomitrium patens]|eukprot:XP_024404062.1 uncharacterized protein LOC112296113 isoform X2 [Physcomitrella patens]